MMKIIDNLKGIFVFEICINCNKWVYRNDKATGQVRDSLKDRKWLRLKISTMWGDGSSNRGTALAGDPGHAEVKQ